VMKKTLHPLKMENTSMLHSKKNISGVTVSCTLNDSNKFLEEDISYLSENFYGSGARYATAEDLFKFGIGIFQHKLFSKATTALVIAPHEQLNNVAFGVWYASGYRTFNKPFTYRTGGIPRSRSNWIHTIDDKKTIILLNKTNAANLYGISENLYKVVKTKQQKN